MLKTVNDLCYVLKIYIKLNMNNSKYDKLFIKLSILLIGRNQVTCSNNVQEYLINNTVKELKQILKGYQDIEQTEKQNNTIKMELKKIEGIKGQGVTLGKIELNALNMQINQVSPYRHRINREVYKILDSLQLLMQVGERIQKVHLQHIKQILPQIHQNIKNHKNTIQLLRNDLNETIQNYERIILEVQSKVQVFEQAKKFHQNFIDELQLKISAL